mmetsp:Transcript_62397/g.129588  ORF Transcript_62397/g.129588 Transcript_62397/m.129588 type:complete len:880 (-) Transcript_62397:340-2979(-)
MALNWRNNPIRPLHRDKNPTLPPELSDWLIWVEGTKRSMGSVGVAYIYNMITQLEWDGESVLTILDDQTPPTLIHDPTSTPFKEQIVKLAIKAGKTFTDENPTETEQKTKTNYNLIETEIVSFGSQVFDSAKEHFSTVFTDASRAEFPMKPLIEWNIIQRLINPKANTDPTRAWNELSHLVQQQPTLTEAWLTDWIAKITKHRSDLMITKGSDAVDSLIIPNVISRIKNAQVDLTQPENLNWKFESSAWHRKYANNAESMTWDSLKADIFLQIGENKNILSTPDSTVGATRPRLHPAAPQGMALAADSGREELIQAAVQAATQAATAAALSAVAQNQEMPPSFSNPTDVVCHNCGGRGHFSRVCPTAQTTQPRPNALGGPPPRQSRHARGSYSQRGGQGGRGMHYHPYAQRGGAARGAALPSPGGRPPMGQSRGGGMSTHGGRGGMAFQHNPAPQSHGYTRPEPPAPGFGMMGYENFEHHQHYEDFTDAQGQEHDYDEQAYFGAEIGMEAHIPGLEGRAAQLGSSFQNQVWGPYYGSQFGTANTADKPSIPESMAQHLDAPPVTRIKPQQRSKFNPFLSTIAATQALVCILQLGSGLAALTPPRTRSAALSAIITMLFCMMLFPDYTHALAVSNTTFALCGDEHPSITATNSFGLSSTTLTNYLVDSGCSTSIITDSTYLTNVRPMIPVQIAGLSGYKVIYLRADLQLPVRTAGGADHVITIKDVFYDPQGHFNLISTDQLNNSRINNNIPYAIHHQVQPDVSWFRPFGCKTTIYQGKDLIEHGPKVRRFGEHAIVPLSHNGTGQDVSIRRALKLQSPTAVLCQDLTGSVQSPTKAIPRVVPRHPRGLASRLRLHSHRSRRSYLQARQTRGQRDTQPLR